MLTATEENFLFVWKSDTVQTIPIDISIVIQFVPSCADLKRRVLESSPAQWKTSVQSRAAGWNSLGAMRSVFLLSPPGNHFSVKWLKPSLIYYRSPGPPNFVCSIKVDYYCPSKASLRKKKSLKDFFFFLGMSFFIHLHCLSKTRKTRQKTQKPKKQTNKQKNIDFQVM